MKLWIAHPRAEEGAYPGEWAVSEVNGRRIANALSEDSAPRIVEAHNEVGDIRELEAMRTELRLLRDEKQRVFDITDTLAALIDKRFEELRDSIPKGGSGAGRVCTYETDRNVFCNLPAPKWFYKYRDGREVDLCSRHAREMRGAKERE